MSPGTQTINFEDTANYMCEARGGPNNMFHWHYHGNKITNDAIYTINTTSTDSILSINNIVGLEHGGMYTCSVSNAAGYENVTAMLLVRSSVVTDPVSIFNITNGSMIQLMCEGDAYPAPSYSWERMAKGQISFEMIVSNRLDVMSSDGMSSLLFQPVLFGDEGYYRCIVSSSSGPDAISDSSNVNGEPHSHFLLSCFTALIVAPGETEISPVVINSFSGTMETLSCSALGGLDNMYNFTYLRTGEVFEDVD